MDEPEEVLAARFQIAELAIPDLVNQSSVAILPTGGTSFTAHGSGTLFRVADRGFVVTAAHVARSAYESGCGLGITGINEIVPLEGEWLLSPETGDQPDRQAGDIAVYALSEAEYSQLIGKEFVRRADLGLQADVERGFFLLLGFPIMFRDLPVNSAEKVGLGTFRFSTTTTRGGSHLAGYFDDVHFLLSAKDDTLTDGRGHRISLRGQHGVRVRLVDGIPGISGCGVWRVGRPGTDPAHWSKEDAMLVGVATSVYREHEAIKVTRWKFVTKLIHAGFPDLKPSLDLFTQNRP